MTIATVPADQKAKRPLKAADLSHLKTDYRASGKLARTAVRGNRNTPIFVDFPGSGRVPCRLFIGAAGAM
jgi:hypothetical protein